MYNGYIMTVTILTSVYVQLYSGYIYLGIFSFVDQIQDDLTLPLNVNHSFAVIDSSTGHPTHESTQSATFEAIKIGWGLSNWFNCSKLTLSEDQCTSFRYRVRV